MIGWQIYLGANFHDTQSSCVEGILEILSTINDRKFRLFSNGHGFSTGFLIFPSLRRPQSRKHVQGLTLNPLTFSETCVKYYILVLIENAIMICMWYPNADPTRGEGFNELLITIIAASFILALLFCVFYYVVWHPKAKIKKMGSKTTLKSKKETVSMIQLGDKKLK